MIQEFYNRLAPFYHLIYGDWETSTLRQSEQIDTVIREVWGNGIQSILDAACGIGTQTIGLAQRGYDMVASDISEGPLERAQHEATKRNLKIKFKRADFLTLSSIHGESRFDLVVACDNAIPHLLTDDEIRRAFQEFHRVVVPGGGCLITVRDYDPNETGVKVVPYGMRTADSTKYLVFQVWEYHGRIYDLSMYFIEDTGSELGTAHIMRAQYYAIPVVRIMELMREAGFTEVRRWDDRFFQPLITGKRPAKK